MLVATAVAGETEWVVDASTTELGLGTTPVRAALDCRPFADQPLFTVGVAAVVYSRKQGTMAWGHASVRAIGCRHGLPFDAEYEVYRMGSNPEEVNRVLEGHPVLGDRDYLRAQRDALFWFRNDDPVDAGFFAQSHAHNREIYELWFDWPRARRDALVVTLEGRLTDQADRLDRREPLDGQYGALSTNCTLPLQQALDTPWHLPFRYLRELAPDAQLRVLHPSHHVLMGWDEVPTSVARPRPIFRWRRRIDAWDGRAMGAPALPRTANTDTF